MHVNNSRKFSVEDLAIFNGKSLFEQPKSTSSLSRPDFQNFLHYSKEFFSAGHYTNNGPLVRKLESRLASFHQAEFCITFCSGFWALVLAISSLKINGKSEVIMPSLTYRRMADIAAWVGLTPRFCEVDEDTLSLSAETVNACINENTAIILAVHPIVNCCDVQQLIELGRAKNIPVLFDSVESVYEAVPTGKVGGIGEAEVFSMHASKLLNGFEGGYVTTNNAELAEKLSILRTFGFKGQDNCVIDGALNAKLNEIHAAMALANLDDIERLVQDNKKRYQVYEKGLAELKGLRLLDFNQAYPTSYKNIVAEVLGDWSLSRDLTVSILNTENILARAYYSPPLHKKKMAYSYIPAELPVTEELSEKFLLLPCGDLVTTEDIEEVIGLLRFIGQHGTEILMHLDILQKNNE
ncbi:MAG: aminotransferase [Porticoccus sp.]|nr:MAG: aminotransferase [Porticoccus sp.]